ncbi:alkaline phosphatase family protein [Actinokineospora bangkokensis]|uniref:Alkaline phosphatase family protein n=1 Tax=Actinokineospora bangkokensis TaxID=1193682 RepID=A0A1Q9LJA4_9PSEU|nr:nucleotide pyrophosphatase/phosphodiesterase family protein [Actinokineospora bangkokensis]OLR92132.1 alkaline phosphatase family protein [Actinokineospora bangkokensis]
MDPLVPAHGSAALADVTPSLLAGLGVPDQRDTLGLAAGDRVCLLLVDGLGWELLRAHADAAPFLSSLADRSITAGFPATTATSLTSLGTGLPSGEHGVVGLSFTTHGEVLDVLRWQRYGTTEDLRERLPPEQVQQAPTAFERATAAGVSVRVVQPAAHAGSGLTRAAFRGGQVDGVFALGDTVHTALAALAGPAPVFVYAYHADLDALGHLHGPGSGPWLRQLAFVDALAAAIADGLPRGAALVVTADHGMVTADDRVDLDVATALRDGVEVITGEPRVRHVHVRAGAAEDVRAAWEGELGGRAWVRSRAEAVAAGWFGPRVADHVLPRVGDLVVAARGGLVLTRGSTEPVLSALLGQHGSLTPAEQLVPLLVHRG